MSSAALVSSHQFSCQLQANYTVNTRNICHLLNDIAPCAVSEFKDAGLEYVCLQLETMLDNQYVLHGKHVYISNTNID